VSKVQETLSEMAKDLCSKLWEQGEAKPTGATLKLLSIVERKGLDVIA
jgi:putative transcriptional regulator